MSEMKRLDWKVTLGVLFLVLLLDQGIKALVVLTVPYDFFYPYPPSSGFNLIGEWLKITHLRNSGSSVDFGLGSSVAGAFILLKLLPVLLSAILLIWLMVGKQKSVFQSLAVGFIVGGGLGNWVDRWIRPAGVVDYIDLKAFGYLGFDRFPVFNLADLFIFAGAILFFAAFLTESVKEMAKKIKDNKKL